MSITTNFAHNWMSFSSPAIGIIDNNGSNEKVLPASHGDCTINITEDVIRATLDETGNTLRELYGLGQNCRIEYPIKKADMTAIAWALRGDDTLATTADPDGSGSLAARSTLQSPIGPRQLTAYSFDLQTQLNPQFDAAGDDVTRTVDKDKFGLYLAEAFFMPSGGSTFVLHNNESVFTLVIEGAVASATGNLWRAFNTDLAVA